MKPFWLVGTVADFIIFNLSFAFCVCLEPRQVNSRCLRSEPGGQSWADKESSVVFSKINVEKGED